MKFLPKQLSQGRQQKGKLLAMLKKLLVLCLKGMREMWEMREMQEIVKK
jgi:hypothetical protein